MLGSLSLRSLARPERALTLIAASAIAGAAGALVGDPLGIVVLALAFLALLAGALQPRLLVPLVAAGCVVLPPYVGWLLPGGIFVNLQRGVMYAGLFGVGIWVLRRRIEGGSAVPGAVFVRPWTRLSFQLFVVAWILGPVIGLALGLANSARAMNTALYQALAFYVGLVSAEDANGRRVLQLTFALLVLYTLPFWLYELAKGNGLFAWYVPPLPDLLSGRMLLLRGGLFRPEATFGQPLAFGQFLLIAMPVAFSLTYTALPRLIPLTVTGVGLVALLATRSRSPWIALLMAAIAVFILRRSRLRVSLAMAALLVALGAIPLARAWQTHAFARQAKAFVTARYSSRTEAEFSAVGRILLTVGSLKKVGRRPLTGYGMNATATSARLVSVDDYYLRLAVDQGVVVALLLSLALLLGWAGVARSAAGREVVWMAFGAGAYLVEWLFVGLYDTSPLLFLVVGNLFGTQPWRAAATEARSPRAATPEGGE